MITNRCEWIDQNSRMQCNQEAFADFTGDRQRLCKLHTFTMVNGIDSVDRFNAIGPVTVFNESDKNDLSLLLETKMKTFETQPEAPPVEDAQTEQDINRSDKEQNEVK